MDDAKYTAFLAERRERILERVRRACECCGRDVGAITLMAVSKGQSAQAVACAREAGWTLFGENRVPELVAKIADLRALGADPPAFHMIGNLQSRQIAPLLGNVTYVESVSSLHVAEALSRRAVERGLEVPALLEVNVSGEPTKQGFSYDELLEATPRLTELAGISIEGLMTMAPAHDAEAARQTFREARALAREVEARFALPLPTLSAGMSDDFEMAVEEGSTLLRLGRVAFDESYAMDGGKLA